MDTCGRCGLELPYEVVVGDSRGHALCQRCYIIVEREDSGRQFVFWTAGVVLLLVATMVLLGGCSGLQAAMGNPTCPTHSTSVPAVPEAQLRREWVYLFGPLPSTCSYVWDFAVVPDQDMAATCPNDNGCTIFTLGPRDARVCPLSMAPASMAGNTELARHEFAHYMLECSRGDADPNHSRFPDVWTQFDHGGL